MEDEQKGIVIYEGKCRSFTTTTTSDKGEIISSYRKLSLEQTQDEWTDDMQELYKKALQVVMEEQKASMSLLQRKLCIGYYKAGLLIERMEKENYIEDFKGGSSRKVLITKAQFDENFNV